MIALLMIGAALVAVSPIGKTIHPVHAETLPTPPSTAWSRTYGGIVPDYALSVIQTSDGGYVLAGYTSSFGAGKDDAWLVKTDSAGAMKWNKTFGGNGSDYASSVVQTNDGGYAFAGSTDSFGAGSKDAWLVKTDSSGNAQWNKTYGGTDFDVGSSVVQTSNGGFALAGFTNSSGFGGYDFWLIKTDSAGIMLWNKSSGGTGYDQAFSVVQTSDEGYAIAGSTDSFGAGSADAWLIKTDSAGGMQWNKTYGGTGYDYAYSVVQTGDGGYALAGGTASLGAGSLDFWLIETDSAGNMQWNKTYGGAGDDESYSLAQTKDGGYALAGYTTSFGAGKADFWLVKADSAGNMQWNQTYGGTGNDIAYSVVQTRNGGYALAGSTTSYGSGSADFYSVKTAGTESNPAPTSTSILYLLALVIIMVAVAIAILVLKKARRRF